MRGIGFDSQALAQSLPIVPWMIESLEDLSDTLQPCAILECACDASACYTSIHIAIPNGKACKFESKGCDLKGHC